MQKLQPGGDRLLCMESIGRAGGEFGHEQAVDGMRVAYWIQTAGDRETLEDLQWADWDSRGRLLAATRSGRLQVRQLEDRTSRLLFEEDLSSLVPQPAPAPNWAKRW
jgi:hypothetical protein